MPSPRYGRPPGGGPPVRFTVAKTYAGTPRWVVREDQEPGEVAAAYAQQLLIARIREHHGAATSASEAARRLRRAGGDRTVADVWAGRRAISLPMLLSLALAFDVHPLGHCSPDDLSSLLPQEHQGWLGAWQPGNGLPVFRQPSSPNGEPAWKLAARYLSEWVGEAFNANTLHLTNDEVITHATANALATAGLPADLASTTDVGRGLHYESQPEIDVAGAFLADHSGSSRPELLQLLRRLRSLHRHADHRAIAMLLIAPRQLTRLDALLPGCRNAVVGDTLRVPPATLRQVADVDPGSLPADFELTMLASDLAVHGHAAQIYELSKPSQA